MTPHQGGPTGNKRGPVTDVARVPFRQISDRVPAYLTEQSHACGAKSGDPGHI